jgi:hypothetical protein
VVLRVAQSIVALVVAPGAAATGDPTNDSKAIAVIAEVPTNRIKVDGIEQTNRYLECKIFDNVTVPQP